MIGTEINIQHWFSLASISSKQISRLQNEYYWEEHISHRFIYIYIYGRAIWLPGGRILFCTPPDHTHAWPNLASERASTPQFPCMWRKVTWGFRHRAHARAVSLFACNISLRPMQLLTFGILIFFTFACEVIYVTCTFIIYVACTFRILYSRLTIRFRLSDVNLC